jgi:hypothetical protein
MISLITPDKAKFLVHNENEFHFVPAIGRIRLKLTLVNKIVIIAGMNGD